MAGRPLRGRGRPGSGYTIWIEDREVIELAILSYTKAIQRLRRGNAHDRLYTLDGTRAMLHAHGFVMGEVRRFFMVPTMLNGTPDIVKSAYQNAAGLVWSANDLLERTWPLNLLASNLMIVAHKPSEVEAQPGLSNR